MGLRGIAWSALIAACGRVGFDPGQASDAAAVTDAPTAGDAPVAGDAAAAGCSGPALCPTFAAVCDSFEAAAIDTMKWSFAPTDGNLSIDPTRACRGGQSLHVQTLAIASGTASAGLHRTPFPVARTTVFVRVYLLIPSASAPQTSAQTYVFLQATQPAGSAYGVLLQDANGQVQAENFEATNASMRSPDTFPLDRWICVEWEVDFPSADGVPDGATRQWIDGVAVTQLDPFGGLAMPPSTAPIDQIEIGMAVYGSPVALPAADVWIDDVAVANQRIGCGS